MISHCYKLSIFAIVALVMLWLYWLIPIVLCESIVKVWENIKMASNHMITVFLLDVLINAAVLSSIDPPLCLKT